MNQRFRSTNALGARFACLLAASTLGCYTFHPSLEVHEQTIQNVCQSASAVVLIISPSYKGYTSLDRGHRLADPQIYRIGEALAPLTEEYFRHSFSDVLVIEDSELTAKSAEGRFIIFPQVSAFENTLTMFPTTQTLEIWLSAEIATDAATTIGRAEGHGSSTHRVHFIKDDESRISGLLSEVIQHALAGLVNQAVKRVEGNCP